MTFKLRMRFDNEQGNMKRSTAKLNFGSDDSVWVLLAELSLSDFLSDHDRSYQPRAGILLQMVRDLGMPLECVESIAMLVTEFAKEPPMHYEQGGVEFPGRIRIFCQKKIIDDENAARSTLQPYPTEQAMKHSPMMLDFGTKMNGGWGCFLIKRGGKVFDDASVSADHFVDLYLYREG